MAILRFDRLIPLSSAENITGDREAVVGAEGVAKSKSTFVFLPLELSGKCRTLIESYHAMHGFAGLPDMLWASRPPIL
jgi:hypothetical protein